MPLDKDKGTNLILAEISQSLVTTCLQNVEKTYIIASLLPPPQVFALLILLKDLAEVGLFLSVPLETYGFAKVSPFVEKNNI